MAGQLAPRTREHERQPRAIHASQLAHDAPAALREDLVRRSKGDHLWWRGDADKLHGRLARDPALPGVLPRSRWAVAEASLPLAVVMAVQLSADEVARLQRARRVSAGCQDALQRRPV